MHSSTCPSIGKFASQDDYSGRFSYEEDICINVDVYFGVFIDDK